MSLSDCEVTIKSQPLKVWTGQETGAYGFEFRVTIPENVQVDEIIMTIVRPTFTEMSAPQDYTTIRFRLPETKTVVGGTQVIDLSYFDKVSQNGGAYRLPFIFDIYNKAGDEVTYTCISEVITVFRENDPKLLEKSQECFFRHWKTRGQEFRLWAQQESDRLGQKYSFINDTMLKFNSQSLKVITVEENKLLKLYFDSIAGNEHMLDSFWNYTQNKMVNKVLEKQWSVLMKEHIVQALEKRSDNRRRSERSERSEQKEPEIRTESEKKREHRRYAQTQAQKECRDNLDEIHRMRASRARRSEVSENRTEHIRPARQHRKTPIPNPGEPTYKSTYTPSQIPGHVPPYVPASNSTYNPAYNPAYDYAYDPTYDPTYSPVYNPAYDPEFMPPNPRVVNVDPRNMPPSPPPPHRYRRYY